MTSMKITLSQKNTPKGWTNSTIGIMCNVDYGTRVVKSRIIPGVYDVYGGGGKTFSLNEFNRENCVIVSRFAMSANCARKISGKFFLNDSGLSLSVVDTSKIVQDYVNYFLLANQKIIYSLGRGAAQKNLNIDDFKKIDILVPSLNEQKKIAEILSSVDEEIQKVDELILKTEKLKKCLVIELFTKGIGHKKFKKTKIGVIPEDWGVANLSEIGSNTIGLTYSPKDVVSDGGVLVFRSSNIFGNRIKYGDNVYVKKEIPNHLITKRGDILLCTRNGSRNLIGKNAYIDTESEGNSFGAFMSVYRTQYSKFVFQFFQSKFFKDQVNQYLGATINQITTKSLNSFLLPLPSMEEQDKITRILISFDEKLETNKKLKEKLIQLKKGLMSDLLSGKVRVIK